MCPLVFVGLVAGILNLVTGDVNGGRLTGVGLLGYGALAWWAGDAYLCRRQRWSHLVVVLLLLTAFRPLDDFTQGEPIRLTIATSFWAALVQLVTAHAAWKSRRARSNLDESPPVPHLAE